MEEMEFRKKYEGREKVNNIEEFTALFNEAQADADDYGAIVRHCTLMMNAAFNLVNNSPIGGITGFQAGFIMWDMVHKFGMFPKDTPLKIVDYSHLLFPQYAKDFNSIPSYAWEWAQREAKNKLSERVGMHPEVEAHMKSVAEGKVPFGLKVEIDT